MADVFGVGSIFGSLISGAANTGIAALNNYSAADREEHAREENYIYNELSANHADARTRKLYEDLYSPAAQLRQLKEAGLSPSLFYGDGGGISGQAGAQGGGAAGIAPQVFGIPPLDLSQMAVNFANADLLKEKTKTEEETRQPTIAETLANAAHANAAAAASKAQAEGQALHNYVLEHTKDAEIFEIQHKARSAAYSAEKMYHELRSAKVLGDLNEELYETNVEKGKKELDLLISSIKLNDQQAQKLRNDVLKSFDEIAQEWKKIDIAERNQVSYTNWLEQRIPQIDKELDLKLGELNLENKRFIKDAIIESLRAAAITAISISSFKGGNGSQQMPTIIDQNGKPMRTHTHMEKGEFWTNRGLNLEKNKHLYNY